MKTSDISDLAVCQACENRGENDFITDELARMFPDAPEKVLYSAMERASDRDLLNYGTSLRGGWLTDKGRALLESRKTTEGPTPPSP
jgi:hypothetical protein